MPTPAARLKCDPRMARLLSRAYQDALTAMTTYTYHSILLKESHPPMSEEFHTLSQAEWEHFRLLGRAIQEMGGDPAIRTDLRIRAASPCPDAATAWQMLHAAIAAERTSAWEYRALADKTRDGALRQLLCRLSAEEEELAALLRELC